MNIINIISGAYKSELKVKADVNVIDVLEQVRSDPKGHNNKQIKKYLAKLHDNAYTKLLRSGYDKKRNDFNALVGISDFNNSIFGNIFSELAKEEIDNTIAVGLKNAYKVSDEISNEINKNNESKLSEIQLKKLDINKNLIDEYNRAHDLLDQPQTIEVANQIEEVLKNIE